MMNTTTSVQTQVPGNPFAVQASAGSGALAAITGHAATTQVLASIWIAKQFPRDLAEAISRAMSMQGGAITRNKILVMRAATIGHNGRMPNMESPAQRAKRLHHERMAAEREALLDAVSSAVDNSYYEEIRTEQTKNGDEVSISIAVKLDVIGRKATATASGSVKLKSDGYSYYDDPAQQRLAL